MSRRDIPASEPSWNPGDYAEYLAPTSLGPIDGGIDLITFAMEHDAEELAQALLVIDDQDAVFERGGRH